VDKALILADRLKKLKDQVDSLATKQTEIQTIKGDQGPKGEQGDRGFDGAPGLDGRDGKNGTDGADGKDGVSVIKAEIAFDGSLVLYLSNGDQIDCGEVTPAKSKEVFQTIKNSGGSSPIDIFTSLLPGLVPASGGGTVNFLRADGTFAAPPGGAPASPTTSVQFNNAGAFGGSANFTYDTGTNTVSFGNITGSATSMTIQPKAPTSGSGGLLEILTRQGVGINSSGGDLTLTLGSGNGTGSGGNFSLVTGLTGGDDGATFTVNGASPGVGGSLFAGSGFSATGAGGDFSFFLGGGFTDDGNMYFQDSASNNFIHCKTASPGGALQIGFFNAAPVVKPAPTASGTGAVLSSVVTALNNLGLVDSAALTNSSAVFTTGTATLDFGSGMGSNEASVAVTGQTGILSTSTVTLTVKNDATSTSHTANDHSYFLALSSLNSGTPTAGTGFTIKSRSIHKLTGTWTVSWSWL